MLFPARFGNDSGRVAAAGCVCVRGLALNPGKTRIIVVAPRCPFPGPASYLFPGKAAPGRVTIGCGSSLVARAVGQGQVGASSGGAVAVPLRRPGQGAEARSVRPQEHGLEPQASRKPPLQATRSSDSPRSAAPQPHALFVATNWDLEPVGQNPPPSVLCLRFLPWAEGGVKTRVVTWDACPQAASLSVVGSCRAWGK